MVTGMMLLMMTTAKYTHADCNNTSYDDADDGVDLCVAYDGDADISDGSDDVYGADDDDR